MMTRLRSFSGSPEVSVPMITTLSPAMVRSISTTWPSVTRPAVVKMSAKLNIAPGAPLLVHRSEEVLVRLGVLHLVEQELHRVDRAHLHQDPAQHPHFGEDVLIDQQLFLAGAGLADIQRGENALVGDLAVEHDFTVAGALELFEDDFIHF